MNKRTISVLAAAGLLAAVTAAPVAAQTVEVPEGEPLVLGTFGVLSTADAALGQDWLTQVN